MVNSFPSEPRYADVVVAVPSRGLDRPWTYRVPPDLAGGLRGGAVVEVPFHGRTLTGYVVGLRDALPSDLSPASVKDVRSLRSAEACWGEDLLALAEWMQSFYGCVLVDALHAVLPEPVRAGLGAPRKGSVRVRVVELRKGVCVVDTLLDVLDGEAPQAHRLVEALRTQGQLPPGELLDRARASREVLGRLKDEGLLAYRLVKPEALPASDDPIRSTGLGETRRLDLLPAQREAVDRIVALTEARKPAVVLLHGITGSGKTEVYLHALERVIAQGRQGLVLVPEISLTPQAVHRYKGRLGERVAVLHSALTPAERSDEWWRLHRGEVPVALGARSCVFAPLHDAALTIVDEEHDGSYKQEQSPRYHARQIAIRRAMHSRGVVVLGSATPSLESYYWAKEGRYDLVELDQRATGAALPEVELVDLRRSSRGRSLGHVLRERMREALARGEQVMLLMNRRGFCSYLLCPDCGHVEKCPRCDISLTFHQSPPALVCHYCLYERTPSSACRTCKSANVRYFGSGTQRVEEELREAFPGVSAARMDRDTTRGAGDHRRLLERFGRGEVQVLVGTQMIAKGHDFPGVSLVGVVLADTALNLPDFRAAERTFSLLVQVSGRAGRGEVPGRVVVQTFNPEHPAVIHASRQDYKAFYEEEVELRRALAYPPFSHLVNVVFAGEEAGEVRDAAERMAGDLAEATLATGAALLGPAPCPVGRMHRKYRWHLTFKARKVQEIIPMVRNYLGARSAPHLQVTVDADPMSML